MCCESSPIFIRIAFFFCGHNLILYINNLFLSHISTKIFTLKVIFKILFTKI